MIKNTLIITAALVILAATYQTKYAHITMKEVTSKVNVWDTYVTKKDGGVMHFDILAPVEIVDTAIIYNYGNEYLKTKGQEGQPLTSKQCRLCHVETVRPAWEKEIAQQGYFIIEMEGCK